MMKLLPKHSQAKNCKCTCNDRQIWCYDRTIGCRWTAAERDSPFGWAIRIYEELEANLEAKEMTTWYSNIGEVMDCTLCKMEGGCCKKRKLALAMTSQILDWLKQHQDDLSSIHTGEQQILVYCRDMKKSLSIDPVSSSQDSTDSCSSSDEQLSARILYCLAEETLTNLKCSNSMAKNDVKKTHQDNNWPTSSQHAFEQQQPKRQITQV